MSEDAAYEWMKSQLRGVSHGQRRTIFRNWRPDASMIQKIDLIDQSDGSLVAVAFLKDGSRLRLHMGSKGGIIRASRVNFAPAETNQS